jgi:hypothetical protein
MSKPKPKPPFEITWVAKKPSTYCRQHGERIVGYLNGMSMCKKCMAELSDIIEDTL